jgi:inner membrane protein
MPQRPRLLLTAGRRLLAHVEHQFSAARVPIMPPVAALGVLIVDLVISGNSLSIPVLGPLDEIGHLLTAAIILLALPLSGWRIAPWALLGAVAIDADHIPLYTFASDFSVGGRPPTHSLLTVLVLLSVAGSGPPAVRIPCAGLALGVCLHFVRDVSTGPGLPLIWPVSDVAVRWPYAAYTAILGLAMVAAIARLWRQRTGSSG